MKGFGCLVLLLFVLAGCSPQTDPVAAPAEPGSSELQEAFTLINQVRLRGQDCGPAGHFPATQPLRWNEQLAGAARSHSQDLLRNVGTGSHVGSDGSRVMARVERQGYAWSWVGENIAWGEGLELTPEEALTAWLESPSHCENIMNPNFIETGIGKAGSYWTQVFANPRRTGF